MPAPREEKDSGYVKELEKRVEEWERAVGEKNRVI